MWVILGFAVVTLLAISVVRGAPYVPTHQRQVELSLDLLNLRKNQLLVDVGSGDGRVLLAAARRGLRAVGYEINPLLCLVSWWRCRAYRRQVTVVWGDMWRKTLPKDTAAIFVFTMGWYMARLQQKVIKDGLRDVQLVSHAFEIPGQTPVKKAEAVMLYRVGRAPKG